MTPASALPSRARAYQISCRSSADGSPVRYHDTVATYFDPIRKHIDRLEEIVDDQMWPLPKYRELLFLR